MADNRIVNFSAGPSMLPIEVLKKASSEMTDYEGCGMSVMEMSHRSSVYDSIIKETETSLRKALSIPNNYKVLFMQGGGTMQFSAVPLNLMTKGVADYALTGYFSKNAAKEASKFGKVNIAASSEDRNFSVIPLQSELKLSKDADYFYLCDNNTIYGTEWTYIPDTNGVPIVSDMSSNILSKPIDVSKYGLIFAGAQKNMGPSGVTVVIVRDDLIGHYRENMPTLLDYKLMADKESMYNTPPTYAIYVLGMVVKWVMEDIGGVESMHKINMHKASILYDFLDQSSLFKATADRDFRSLMNVTFTTNNKDLDDKFVKESVTQGMTNLKGHRAVGGMRASIYNCMPTEGVTKLVEFMKKFELENK